MKRITIRVMRRADGPGWVVAVGGLRIGRRSQYLAAVEARSLALQHALTGGLAEVVIHRRDGTIGQRDTYPRSSDPRRSRG